MQSDRKEDEQGRVTSSNWMLDEILDTCRSHGVKNEKLTDELFIQRVEYGRICIAQLLAQGGQTIQSMKEYYKKLDSNLKEKITKAGGTPQGHKFLM
jgi:ribosomal protein L15